MWNRPQLILMKAVADLLFMASAVALLAVVVVWVARLPLFPIREVVILDGLKEVQRGDIERSLSESLHGNFFSVDLEKVRLSLEQLPWVRNAEARRQWPADIEVNIEEHIPVAFWGEATGQLVNSRGEIFMAEMQTTLSENMPILQGPSGFVPEILGFYQQAVELLKPIGRWPMALNMSPRLALQLRLDDGMVIELGRSQAKAPVHERLARFATYYPTVLEIASKQPSVVDMRYPQGFVLRAAVQKTESEGTP